MMNDTTYFFAERLTLMARWLAVGADRDRIASRVEADRRAGRRPSKQTAEELAQAQSRMDNLEAKLRSVQAGRDNPSEAAPRRSI